MRILILSQVYDPEPIPKPAELAKELQLRGHTVNVITGLPNYPSGKLYPGTKLRALQHTQINGIPVTRTFEYPYHGKNAIGRILNYFSFMVSAPFGLHKIGPIDVIYVWHPPLTVGIAAWIMAKIARVPFVYDVQDIWPESIVLSGILNDGPLIKLLSVLERFVYKQANHLIVVTDKARDNLVDKGVHRDKVSVMPHWLDENIFSNVDAAVSLSVRKEMGFDNRFVILFAGNIGLVQGLDTIIYAAQKLHANKEILIVFLGDGADKKRLKKLSVSLNLENSIRFNERQPLEKMPGLMTASNALLVHLKASELSDFIIPTKTIAYLASGKPIIMAAEGAATDLVINAGAGIAVEPENPSALAKAILKLQSLSDTERNKMGQHGRKYFLSHFSKSVVIPLYESLLEDSARVINDPCL